MSGNVTVTLRTHTEADLEVLYAVASDLDTWEERRPSLPAPLTRKAFEARLAELDSGDDKGVTFVIDADGAAVGTISLFSFDDLARHAEVGIALLAEARGRGIGTAAIGQMLEFAFVRCNLRRVHLQAIASNAAAVRAYEKAGFLVEGRLRDHAWVRGRYEDIVVMGVLRPEWEERNPPTT